MKETARFLDLISEVNPTSVAVQIRNFYAPAESEFLDTNVNRLIDSLRKLTPADSDGSFLEIIEKSDSAMTTGRNWDVFLRRRNDPRCYSLSFLPRAKWLPLGISRLTWSRWTATEIAAHCIWEMTFYGWENEPAEFKRQKIQRRLSEAQPER